MLRVSKFALCASIVLGFAFIAVVLSSPSKWKSRWDSLFSKQRDTSHFAVQEHKPFVIIVASYNNADWAEKNLQSIFEQKYDNYRVIYIDDASKDATFAKIKKGITKYQQWHRVELIHNDFNRGAVENIYRAVHSCLDEEIVVLLDGDDWFPHAHVLERLNEAYADPSAWLTYGSYVEYPSYSYTVANFSQELPLKVIEKNSVREFTRQQWYLSHLRTFYSSLFKKIKMVDLLYEGKYVDAAYDQAFMIPMVEMAGFHARFIKDILCIYNRTENLKEHQARSKRQQLLSKHILGLPCYKQLASLDSDRTLEEVNR